MKALKVYGFDFSVNGGGFFGETVMSSCENKFICEWFPFPKSAMCDAKQSSRKQFHAGIFFLEVCVRSRSTDKAKEGILVV